MSAKSPHSDTHYEWDWQLDHFYRASDGQPVPIFTVPVRLGIALADHYKMVTGTAGEDYNRYETGTCMVMYDHKTMLPLAVQFEDGEVYSHPAWAGVDW